MDKKFLYETLDSAKRMGFLKDIPTIVETGLASHIQLREYQEEAFKYFITYYENENLSKNKQIHTLFHMATGARVIIMTGCINVLESRVSGTSINNNSCIY